MAHIVGKRRFAAALRVDGGHSRLPLRGGRGLHRRALRRGHGTRTGRCIGGLFRRLPALAVLLRGHVGEEIAARVLYLRRGLRLGALGLFALVERGHDRVVNEIKHALFAHELHDGLGRVDVHIHHVARQLDEQHAAGELALHHAVGVGFFERSGKKLGFDETPVDKKRLHAARAARGDGRGHKARDAHVAVRTLDLKKRERELTPERSVNGGAQRAVAGGQKRLRAVLDELERHLRMRERKVPDKARDGRGLRAVALHKL